MAHLLNVEGVGVVHGARAVLAGVSLGLDDGMRIGVVGRNGDGKSTLLRVMAREQEPDAGRVTHTRDIRLGLLHQSDEAGETTVRHLVLGDAPDHVWAADALARDVVAGLLGGLDAAEVGGLDATLARLSGGQRRRVALAALLARPHDVLLLDEPTNHLDVEGVAWLATHLRSRWPAGRGALAVVTHDRWFLDAVCERTWEVHDGVVDSFEGGYAAYVLARAERSRIAATTEERRQNLLRKELAWLRRGPPARTSKPRFRIDAATALIANEPPARDSLELTRMATARLGKDVIDIEDVTVSVGAGEAARVLLDGVTWRLAPGERVGLVGVNGAGKTTLLRLLLGEITPVAGRVKRGKTVVTAMLSQDVRELDDVADLRVGEAVEKVRGTVRIGDRDVTAGQMLERLGFAKERIWTPVAELSGGERRRLQLLRLLMGEPNVLMLDEPTNDLDTDTLAAIEDTLDSWPGTLVVVSHDRYLLERVTDHQLALLGDGALRDLPGGVEQYLELRSAALASPSRAERAAASAPSTAASASSGAPTVDPAAQRAARKDMARLERQLSRLSGQEEKLHARMAEQAGDHTVLMALDVELRALHAERTALEEEWLTAAELVD
ncbi:MAG: ABC-F family ATP-binding cassette domain-containing protein [Kineosporiaceae bacterium]|nr:ABC-F family ATP-binding cassette domain-containing protein [Kineosporiaceae bacterium]MBK7622874.1 ABC-F family ATP-binding cassette domain-containing protein [Kineosporiaceae bacterium]